MLNPNMKILKDYQKKVERDYFLTEGIIDIDQNYFIDKIKKGTEEENNNNFKTNVTGLMTSWNYFVEDKTFLDLACKFVDYIDKNNKFKDYHLTEAWGFGSRKYDYTKPHMHGTLFSGVLYLNDHAQSLDFDEINIKIKPNIGKFVLFSSFLQHKCIRHYEKEIKWGISFNFEEITNF